MTGAVADALKLLADAFDPVDARARERAGREVGLAILNGEKGEERYERILGRAVPPFAGVFLHPEGLAGGQTEAVLRQSGSRVGVSHFITGDADHVASQARLLAGLLENGGRPAFEPLAEHMLMWLPPLAIALDREEAAEYAEATRILVETILMAWGSEMASEAARPVLADLPPPVGDDDSLGRLSGWITTHAATGVFVGRSTVARWGRSVSVPRGFGSSKLMLKNLLESAGRFGELEAVLARARGEVDWWTGTWASWVSGSPDLQSWFDLWRPRLARFRQTLELIEDRIAHMGSA